MMRVFILLASLAIMTQITSGERGMWAAFQGNEYMASPKGLELDYDGARDYCNTKGGDLVLVKNEEIQEFLSSTFGKITAISYRFYIGLQDVYGNGSFMWIDDEKLSYSNWAVGKPGKFGYERCVALYGWYSKFLWRSAKCGKNMGFVCQRKIDETTPSQPTTSTADENVAGTSAGFRSEHVTHPANTKKEATTMPTEQEELPPTTKEVIPESDGQMVVSWHCFFDVTSFMLGLAIPLLPFLASVVKLCMYRSELKKLQESLKEYGEANNNKYEEIVDVRRDRPQYVNDAAGFVNAGAILDDGGLIETPGYEAPMNCAAGHFAEPAYESFSA